jgi:ssDNA-binding domain of telomere protection protein
VSPQVLKGFSNFNGVHTLYVTDYTHNGQVRGVQSNWCPNSLSDYVLQMEMWDDAAEIAQTMREGNYYLIKNARMRNSSAGYLEGKVVQPKIIQLEEEDAQRNSHLQALLEFVIIWFHPFIRD